ncbi:MAG: hypothetical protein QGH07_10160, partial [Alphaproteobacteria bacterium]|nr:hypothetical protein [Alphaproteobacteria bacterium]
MPLYEGFNRLTELTYCFRRLDEKGSEAITREIYERGLAGAVLPYDPVLDRVVSVPRAHVRLRHAMARRRALVVARRLVVAQVHHHGVHLGITAADA